MGSRHLQSYSWIRLPVLCRVAPGVNDIRSRMPEWLSEWDFERNDVAPGKVAVTSARKVWWKCGKGHAYLSSPSCRIRGHGCVYCSGKEILTGFNDFASGYPELLEEWDYRKNRVDPSKISRFTHRRVWWIDRKGHEWMASVSNRSAGKGCPYCGGTKVLSGFNDLRTVTPWIAEEWDDESQQDQTNVYGGVAGRAIPGERRWQTAQSEETVARIAETGRSGRVLTTFFRVCPRLRASGMV